MCIRDSYWMVEFLSISRVILRAPRKYYRAFEFTETDAFDATYFLLHQLRVIKQAVEDVQAYLRTKATELHAASRLLRDTDLNHRQVALLSHAMRHPDAEYSFESHRSSHRIAFQTARLDLLDLERFLPSLGPIDADLARRGEESFKMKCMACHKFDERYVGPALGDVLTRRTPEYVMNMMLNPAEMVQKHPEARAMLAQYMTPMPSQNLTEDEARALLEYMRTAAEEPEEDEENEETNE